MVQLVNGYACNNCADAALARRGINPTAGQRSPAAATGASPAPAAAATPVRVSAPGSLSTGLQPGGTGEPRQLGTALPQRGQILNLLA